MKKLFKNAKLAIAAGLAFVFSFGGAATSQAAPVEFTTPGAGGTPTPIALPFSVPDMLGTAVNFLTMYGEWVLLAIGVIFAPVLYGLAIKLAAAARARSAK